MRHYARNRSRAERKQEPGDPCWYSYHVYPNDLILHDILFHKIDKEECLCYPI
nr:MAG TPA: hypothetical protein [Caudoviricetes sp.]